MMTHPRPRAHLAGTPEVDVADAIAAVYADAHVRLDQLELDITQPARAPHSREEAMVWRAEQDRAAAAARREAQAAALRAAGERIGAGLRGFSDALHAAVRPLAELAAGIAAATTSSTRADFALAGPADGEG